MHIFFRDAALNYKFNRLHPGVDYTVQIHVISSGAGSKSKDRIITTSKVHGFTNS